MQYKHLLFGDANQCIWNLIVWENDIFFFILFASGQVKRSTKWIFVEYGQWSESVEISVDKNQIDL